MCELSVGGHWRQGAMKEGRKDKSGDVMAAEACARAAGKAWATHVLRTRDIDREKGEVVSLISSLKGRQPLSPNYCWRLAGRISLGDDSLVSVIIILSLMTTSLIRH